MRSTPSLAETFPLCRPWVTFFPWRTIDALLAESEPLRAAYRLEASAEVMARGALRHASTRAGFLCTLMQALDLLDLGDHDAVGVILDEAERVAGPEQTPWLATVRAQSLSRRSMLAPAARELAGALALCEQETEGGRYLLCQLQVEQAYLMLWSGPPEHARPALRRLNRRVNKEIAGTTPHRRAWTALQGRILNDRGVLAIKSGDWSGAVRLFKRSAAARKVAGQPFDRATTLNNLCECSIMRSDYKAALRYAHQTLEVFKDAEQRSVILAFCHDNLGDLATRRGEFLEAQAHYRRAVGIAARGGYRRIGWEASLGLAEALLQSGEPALAEHHVCRVLAEGDDVSAATRTAALRTLAAVLLSRASPGKALDAANAGLALAREFRVIDEELPLRRLLAGSLQGIGRLGEAQAEFEEALGLAQAGGHRLEEGRLGLGLALCHQAHCDQGRTEHREPGRRWFEAAREVFEEIGAAADLRLCYRSRFSRQYLLPKSLAEELTGKAAEQVEHLAVLLEVAQDISRQADERELLEGLVTRLAPRAGAEVGIGALVEEHDQLREVVIVADRRVRRARSILRTPWFRELAREGNPRLIAGQALSGAAARWAADNDLDALMLLPLRSRQTHHGAVLFGASRRQPFDKDLLGVWMGFANQAALAIDASLLYQQATRDQLTGVFSRQYTELTLGRELHRADRSGASTAVLFLDLDHFKSINDSYGHQAGDRALRRTARTLQAQLRFSDLIGRWGGEEFLVALFDTPVEFAFSVADKLREAVAAELTQFEPGRDITVSIGLACSGPENAVSVGQLIDRADQALYRAKRDGRNRVVAWSPDL